MSMNRLTVGEMIYNLEFLLNDKRASKIINNVPMLKLMLGNLKKSLETLENSRGKPGELLSPEQESAIRKEIQKFDHEHDQGYRLLHGLLSLTEQHSTDEKDKEQSREVIDALMPYGLRITRMKYIDEVGEAKRLEKQLQSTELKSFLESIEIGIGGKKTDALKQAERIVKAAENMQEQLLKLEGGESNTLLSDARKLFYRTMRRFVFNAEEELYDDADKLSMLLSVYRDTTQKASKRGSQKSEEKNNPTPS